MSALVDGRDAPMCRALGRAWWRRHGRTVVRAVFDTRPSGGHAPRASRSERQGSETGPGVLRTRVADSVPADSRTEGAALFGVCSYPECECDRDMICTERLS